ncbi:MAG: hypothetical protein Q3976_04730 [Corynebacterium sp.]|nr:hypothetical protein [Corynebacterium sp.]
MAFSTLSRVLLASMLAGSLVLTGCSSSEETAVDMDDAVGVEVAAARVNLVEAGQFPHEELRFTDFEQNQQLQLNLSSTFNQLVDSAAAAAPAPDANASDFQATLDATTMEATNSDTGSNRSIQVTLNDITAESAQTSAQQSHLESAQGFSFGWYADERGMISSINFAAPAEATDEGRSLVEGYITQLLSLPVVFPTEPVGIGGSWTVESSLPAEENLLQTITYTLLARDGDQLELSMEVAQRPSQGAINYEDTSLDVISAQTTMSDPAVIKVDLSQPLPCAGAFAYTTRVQYSEAGNDNAPVVTQDSTVGLNFITNE